MDPLRPAALDPAADLAAETEGSAYAEQWQRAGHRGSRRRGRNTLLSTEELTFGRIAEI